ncbi:MAG: hypothetical protein HYZ33_01590 [Ignavibacteriales bacterium]|nr:hypothetical protein [Ignavibacteriales bacterium]
MKPRVLYIVLIMVSQFAFSSGMQSDDSVKTNMQLFRDGIVTLTDSIFNRLPNEKRNSIVVSIQMIEELSFVSQTIVSELQSKGVQVFIESTTVTPSFLELQINSPELRISYGDSFRESFLGETKANRTVTVSLPFLAKDVQSNSVLQSGTLLYNYSDTVSTDMISLLEQQGIPSTHAPMPERNFFDRLLEPLIIIGATGVAVYLFFHVRS